MKIVLEGIEPISWNKFYSSKMHWKDRRIYVDAAKLLVRAALGREIPRFDRPVTIEVVSYRRSKRRFDPDNLFYKPYIDGLVAAGVLEDDSWKQVSWVMSGVRIDPERPRLEINVYET